MTSVGPGSATWVEGLGEERPSEQREEDAGNTGGDVRRGRGFAFRWSTSAVRADVGLGFVRDLRMDGM